MKACLILLALVGFSLASSHPGWKDNTEYVYHVNGRSLTSLHETFDQYSGVFLKAKLHIRPRPNGKLQAWISEAKYSQIQSHMPDGWNSDIPEDQLNYQQLNLSKKPFQIVTKDGIIKSLIMEKDTKTWEANVIKSILSQLQLDIKGKNAVESNLNRFPQSESLEGVFKTMEETVTGQTETEYEIHQLPEYLIQSQPWLAPQHKLKGNGETWEVIKSKNFTNSRDVPAYHFGFGKLSQGEPTSNEMGQFFTRQSSSRMILTGHSSKFTIQSCQTVNKIIMDPTVNAGQQGSCVSALNLTLSEVNSHNQPHQEMSNPVDIGSLVYYDDSLNNLEQSEGQESGESNAHLRKTLQKMLMKVSRKINNKQSVQELAREISKELEQPEDMLSQATLSKYTNFQYFIPFMDKEEIRECAQQLYTENKQVQQRRAWEVFRDAVAEAGTEAACSNIEEWIWSKKIEKHEAAEVFGTMLDSVQAPTKDLMKKMFDFVKIPDVKRQEYLNETALLSYTSLLNRVYINEKESQNQYPVHSYGKFNTQEGKDFVKSVVIPYLSEQLEKAVSQADSRKIHVYIRALGNTGHKQILETFEPYLDGHKQVSQFQRMLMVLSCDKLVKSYPEAARSALYRIYQNAGELPEVRVVAAHQVMRTNPPAEMLQRMAERTNTDAQDEVNAAVKSAIESASKLEIDEAQSLSKSAELAKPLLTKKQYGIQKSVNLLGDFVIESMKTEFKQNSLYIGSTDSVWPKGAKYTLRGNVNGMNSHFVNAQAMVSSIQELTNVLHQQTEKHEILKKLRSRSSEDNKWSSASIAEKLKLKNKEKEQLEGFIYTEMGGALQRIWSFDNKTIQQLPQMVRELEQILSNGKQIQYTKIRQLQQMTLTLPTEVGMPFLYTYNVPVAMQFDGKIKARALPEISREKVLHAPKEVSAEIDGFATVTAKVQSQLCVLTPFDSQAYITGYDRNLQIHLPLKANAEARAKEQRYEAKIDMELEEKHQKSRLFHYHSRPYTSRSDFVNLTPVELRPHTYTLKHQRDNHAAFDVTLGEEQTGMPIRIYGHHPQQGNTLWRLANSIQSEGIASALQKAWDQSSLEETEVSIRQHSKRASANKVTLRLAYESRSRNEPKFEKSENFLNPEQILEASKENQQELMRHVCSGIENAKGYSVHTSAEFKDGRRQHHFVVAYAKSNSAPESRMVAFYKNNDDKPKQLSLQMKGSCQKRDGLDLEHSLNTKPSAQYDFLLQNEEDQQIRTSIRMSRTESRKNMLKDQPMKQMCMQEMREGNQQMPACRNMTIEANYMNKIEAEVEYKKVPSKYSKGISEAFKTLRMAFYPMIEVNGNGSAEEGKIRGKAEFDPENMLRVNVTVEAYAEETKFFNISIGEMAKTIMVPHSVFSLKARLTGKLLEQENLRPTCVIAGSAAQTYSNRTYPLSLGEGWTLMMQYVPQRARSSAGHKVSVAEQLREEPENYAVMVRDRSESGDHDNRRDIKVTLNTPETQKRTVEIDMKVNRDGAIEVSVDGKQVRFDNKNVAKWHNDSVEIYEISNNEVKLEIQNIFYIIYNGEQAILVSTSDKLTDSTVGLCGRFSGDKYEDLSTPQNCVVKSPKKFVESFEIQRRHQGEDDPQECIRKEMPLYANVISRQEVSSRKNSEDTSKGIRLRSRYVEHNGEICFTLNPVPECENGARKTKNRKVPVTCISKSKTAIYLKNQIDQGGNPDFSHKPESKKADVKVAQECY